MKAHALLLAAALPALAFAQRQPAAQAPPKPNLAPAPPKSVKMKWVTEVASKGSIGAIGDTVPIKATLKSKTDGKPFGRKTLSFSVAGRNVGTAPTDATGEAKLSYKVPNDPPPGSVPLTISFAGDDDCHPSAAAVNFTVFKSSTKLTLGTPPSHINEGDTARVSGKLVRITDHEGITGREVLVSVNGNPAGKVVTFEGELAFDYRVPSPFPPKASVEVRFDGDVLYNPTAAKTEFAVENPPKQAYFSWFGARGRVGESVTLMATLTTRPMSVGPTDGIGGQRVRFQLNTLKLCEATTNPLGIAKCSGKLEGTVGSHPLEAYADVNRDKWSVEKKTTAQHTLVEIALSPVRLSLSAPPSARIGTPILIRARLTRTTDNAPIGYASLALSTGREETDANGSARFHLTIETAGGTGPRTFKATYAGNPKRYEKGEGSISINILPNVN